MHPSQHIQTMKIRLSLLIWVWACSAIFAQTDDYYKVVAEQGDGIFSLLRKQGLDPVKHYEEFIKLNSENIKDGSFLKVGVSYKVPVVEDSYKKTGIVVKTDIKEEPIFNEELGEMSSKSDRLKNAVYYLIVEDGSESANGFVEDITRRLAAELMVNGAKVYVVGDELAKDTLPDVPLTETQKMGRYIEVVNKRYLQNNGKYQRVLFIQANGVTDYGNMDVAVYHYNNSEQGQRFAENIQNVFKKNSVANKSIRSSNMIFEEQSNLYLAKNMLPAVSLLTLENVSNNSREKIPVRPNKEQFANWISSGIMNDYVNLEIEN